MSVHTTLQSQQAFVIILAGWLVLSTVLRPVIAGDLDTTVPGRMVEIGTHKMHLNCRGYLSPTVIIDSGLGGFSLEWTNVQNKLSRFSRICTYDRSGYGWSEESPYPRTTRVIAGELYQLLMNAEVPGPYVMVGHSFGGYNIRYSASEYPNLVSGLVFVDASHPEQFHRMPRPEPLETRISDVNKVRQIKMARPVLSRNYPAEYRFLAYRLMVSYKARRTQLAELAHFNESADQVSLNNRLPDVPVTVITRGARVWPHNRFGDESERVWQELQGELVKLSHNSRQLIATRSGHSVHLDQPDMVEHAIIEMLESSRYINDLKLLYVQTNSHFDDKLN